MHGNWGVLMALLPQNWTITEIVVCCFFFLSIFVRHPQITEIYYTKNIQTHARNHGALEMCKQFGENQNYFD